MRVLVARHSAVHIGGVETYVDAIVPAMAAAGHDIALWYEDGAATGPDSNDVVPRWFHRADPESLARVADWQPAIVFSHGLRSPDVERALLAVAPAVLFAHSYMGTCISGNKMHARPAAAVCSRRFGPACLALYYPRRCGGLNPLTAVAMYRRQADRLHVLDRYRRIVVASRHMAQEYARHGFAAKTSIVTLPAPAADPEPRVPRSGSWRLLYLGRLEWTKGADIAVDAVARATTLLGTPIHLVVAGAGSMDAQLRALASRHTSNDARVTFEFAGPVTAEGRSAMLRRSDLLLVPSRWPEPYGLVGNEAGIAGVPAIAFATGGIPEWLTDGVDGRLVASEPEVEPFARPLAALLAEPDTIARMGEASRTRAHRLSVARHVRELDLVFQQVAGTPRP